MVYFNDLFLGLWGSLGHNSIYLGKTDNLPDGSVHWHDGIFILYKKRKLDHVTLVDRMSIYDVAPTVMDLMGLKVPSDMQGKVIPEIKALID